MDWDIVWSAVLGIFLAGFGIFETIALKDRAAGKPGGTLSAYLRKWLGIQPKRWWHWITAPLFAGGLLILGTHILLGWP